MTAAIDNDENSSSLNSEKETGKLLGAQMMCERATDLISEFTQALSAGQTVQDLARVIRPHPTFSEAISEAVRIG